MFVHTYLDPLILEHRPWIGVLIGLVGVSLMCVTGAVFLGEYRSLGRQPHPIEVTADTARLASGTPRMWVTLTEGHWHCDGTVESLRSIPEKWLFGRVESTQIPVTSSTGLRLVVVMYDGEVDCAKVAKGRTTGVLTAEGDNVWGSYVARQITEKSQGPPILVLHANEGPQAARNYLLMSSGFLLGFAVFTAYYGRKWARQIADRKRMQRIGVGGSRYLD